MIIGVGNPDRGDDAAGRAVIARLRACLGDDFKADGIELIEHWGEATSLVETMAGSESVVIVDAAMSGAGPGTWQRFEAGQNALPSNLAEMSSHGFGVTQAIELARVLGSLPKRCRVYAIEGNSFEAGTPLSADVAKAAEAVAAEIIQAIACEPTHA